MVTLLGAVLGKGDIYIYIYIHTYILHVASLQYYNISHNISYNTLTSNSDLRANYHVVRRRAGQGRRADEADRRDGGVQGARYTMT